jgi:hypothetical protein
VAAAPPASLQAQTASAAGRLSMVDEYEGLLARQFYTDPDMPIDAADQAAAMQRADRLLELHDAIFGAGAHGPAPP